MGLINRLGFWKKNDSSDDQDRPRNDDRTIQDNNLDRSPNSKTKYTNQDNLDSSKVREELEELRGFTSENIDKFTEEFSDVRGELETMKQHSSEVHGKMFETLQMVERRMTSIEKGFESFQAEAEKRFEENTERIEKLEERSKAAKETTQRLSQVEDRMESELHRLEKQKVDGKDIVHLSSRPQPSEDIDEEETMPLSDMSDLTKKQRAKVKILQLLKQDMTKTQIRKQIEGDVCSRQWFYKAWDELEKKEAYISGREEALIHPEDYRKELSKRN